MTIHSSATKVSSLKILDVNILNIVEDYLETVIEFPGINPVVDTDKGLVVYTCGLYVMAYDISKKSP